MKKGVVFMSIKHLKLKFWIFITSFLLKFTPKRFKIKILKLILKCQEKELKAFEDLYGYSALDETQR